MVDPDVAGVTRPRSQRWTPRANRRRIKFVRAPAELLGQAGAGAKPLSRTLDQAAIALANEMVGGAQALLDSAVAYTNMRVQFGRTIGSFQAIKHKCADMLLDVELAKSAAYYAAQAAAADDPEWPALACLAKAAASEMYLRIAANRFRFTVASGLPGITTRICGSSAPKARRCFSASRITIGSFCCSGWGVE